MTIKEINEKHSEASEKMDALIEAGKKAAFTKEQKKEFDDLEAEIKELEADKVRLEKIEAREKAKAKAEIQASKGAVGPVQDNESEIKEMNKISKAYSFAKSAQKIFQTKKLDVLEGVEAEMFQEAHEEAKVAGISLSGNIAIPAKFLQVGRRTKAPLSVSAEGTDAVYTTYGGLIPILRPDPIVAQLGITVMSGLQGNVQWTRQNGDVAYAFETESSDVDETTPTLDNISVSPKRFGGYVDVTNQFLIQAPWVVEGWLRSQLETRAALTYDTQTIAGTGASNSCTGILNYSGVNVITLGSGSANDMTYRALLEFIRLTKIANARNGRTGWLTNANGETALSATPMQGSGVEGNFIYKMDGKLIGRPFMTSELVPSDLTDTAGSATAQTDLCGIIYSPRWESAILATWGGVDILFDPYTQALGGKKRFVVNCFMDVEIEQPLEFAVCLDWDATDLPALT
jgi:HK97 family phage major capsid protein